MDYKPILLVEDNPVEERRILKGFERNEMGHIVHVARDGLEALQHLFETEDCTVMRSPPPKLIILDLHLPRVPGLEVLRRIREHPDGEILFVIIFTGSRDVRERAEAVSLGVDGYFQKPDDIVEFFKTLEKIGLTWLVNTQ
jgi:two-component system, response regulator